MKISDFPVIGYALQGPRGDIWGRPSRGTGAFVPWKTRARAEAHVKKHLSLNKVIEVKLCLVYEDAK